MIEISNVQTFGFEGAIHGMRNSYNSWDKSDSGMTVQVTDPNHYEFFIGKDDIELASKLAKAGGSHAKFRRMIHVQMDISAPFYWWKEFDTYKIGTTSNSTSTMHSIVNERFETNQFAQQNPMSAQAGMHLIATVNMLNELRDKYIDEERPMFKKMFWKDIIQMLPSSYMQLRTIDTNYEVLARICKERQNHKLDEWKTFIEKIKELPWADELIFCNKEK